MKGQMLPAQELNDVSVPLEEQYCE